MDWDIDETETKWLVNGLIPQEHAILLLGRPHRGKSWLTEQLAVCVASGTPFLEEFEVAQKSVILIDEDSPTDVLKRRLRRLAKGIDKDIKDLPISISSLDGFILWNTTDMAILIGKIKERHNPLVIIDCLEKVMMGQKLDRTDAATKATSLWNELKVAGATVIIIHHMSLKKEVIDINQDTTALGLGNTMLVAGCDTALCIFSTPTGRTEFTVKPEERRIKLKVNHPFGVILKEDKQKTWARLAISEEAVKIPSANVAHLFPLFLDGEERTVKAISLNIKGDLSDNEIRDSLHELESENVLTRGREAHNCYIYKLNPDFSNSNSLTTSYWDALRELVCY